MRTLTFSISIAADRARVWDRMLAQDTYREWTAAFCPGSSYEGAWITGARMRFLAPGGDGMVATIDEAVRPERVVIRHLGMIHDGAEDTASPAVRAWAPAFERYAFIDRDGSTTVEIAIDVAPAWESMMRESWPKALDLLKRICERA